MAQPAGQALQRFYEAALSEAERADLDAALGVDGVDQEIAVLRLRLRTLLRERPEDLALLFQGVGLIVRLVTSRYRLPRQSQAELKLALDRVLASIGVDDAGEGGPDA